MHQAIVKSPLGCIKLIANDTGLLAVTFLDEEVATSLHIPDQLQPAAMQLEEYFSRKRKKFNLKLAPQGTDFQQKVWHTLNQIPYGKTATYLEMAKTLGDPKVIRAAANANGKNPIAIIIPCHRVIGSDNTLTGYAGGLWRKKKLLEIESPVVQQSLF